MKCGSCVYGIGYVFIQCTADRTGMGLHTAVDEACGLYKEGVHHDILERRAQMRKLREWEKKRVRDKMQQGSQRS